MRIIDNFLDAADFQTLKTHIESTDFPWFYISNVSLPPGAVMSDPMAQETFGYNHMVYDHEDESKSYMFRAMPPILAKFEEIFDIKIEKLL